MKRFVLPLAGIGLGVLGYGSAGAASLDFCHRFATAHLKLALVQRLRNLSPETVHDQAFYLCLNMDDEPAMPTAYVDPQIGGANPPWFAATPPVGGPVEPKAAEAGGGTEQPAAIAPDAASQAPQAAPPARVRVTIDANGGDANGDDAKSIDAPAPAEQPAEAPAVAATAARSDEASSGATTAPARRTGRRRGSGLPQGSPELALWCLEHFPNSYDPDTGTIVPFETGVRTLCR